MEAISVYEAADFEAGTFDQTYIDKLSGDKAKVRLGVVEGATSLLINNLDPPVIVKSETGWSWAAIDGTISDLLAFAYRSVNVQINFTGVAIELRYRVWPGLDDIAPGIILAYLDGVQQDNINCYDPIDQYKVKRFYASSFGAHTLKLVSTGLADRRGQAVSAPSNTVGTSVASRIVAALRPGGYPNNATYTITALSGSTYQVGSGATRTCSDTAINSTDIPGVDLIVHSGLTTSDAATIATKVVEINWDCANYWADFAANGKFTTPIFPTDSNNTLWLLATVEAEFGAYGSGTVAVVQPTPSGPRPMHPIYIGDIPLAPGGQPIIGGMVASILSQTQNCQLQITLSTNDTKQSPSIADLELHYLQLDRDSLLSKLPSVFKRWAISTFLKIFGSFGVALCELKHETERLIGAYSVNGAARDWLNLWGMDLNLPRKVGESDASYRARLQTGLKGSTQGGTIGFIRDVLSQYIGADVIVRQLPGSTVAWVLGTSKLGVDTFLGASPQGYWWFEVIVPATYQGVTQEQIQSLVDFLKPVGTRVRLRYE